MSLEDKVYPLAEKILDGLEHLDDSLLYVHERIAQEYQDRTGSSKHRLTRTIYGTSTGSLLVAALDTPFIGVLSLVPGVFTYFYSYHDDFPDLINAHEGELRQKTFADNSIRTSYAVMYSMSTGFLLSTMGNLLYGIIDQDGERMSHAMKEFPGMFGLFSFFSGQYFTRVKIDPPKKKRKNLRGALHEKLRDLLSYPSPRPAEGHKGI